MLPGDPEGGMGKWGRAGQAANKGFVTQLGTTWVTGAQFHWGALETSIEHTELSQLGLMTLGEEFVTYTSDLLCTQAEDPSCQRYRCWELDIGQCALKWWGPSAYTKRQWQHLLLPATPESVHRTQYSGGNQTLEETSSKKLKRVCPGSCL